MVDNADISVTVFTPTYNRDRYITNLYQSLCGQSVLSFEWLVVDQGHDRTEELVRGFAKEAPFPVVYHRLEGERGIARAINAMLGLARGQLVIKVDDDDTLTPDAIEAVLDADRTIMDRSAYAGVSGLKMYPDGKAIGSEWNHTEEWIDCTNLERKRYGLEGDKAEAYYLKVMQEYGPIPTVPGEYYTWEELLWDRIAHAGKLIRWTNRKIYSAEYLPGGATDMSAKAKLSNFKTYTMVIAARLTYREIPFLDRLKASCRYFELLREKKLPFSAVKDEFSGSPVMARLGYAGSAVTRYIHRD